MSTTLVTPTTTNSPYYLDEYSPGYSSKRASIVSSTDAGNTEFETAPNSPLRSGVSLVGSDGSENGSVHTLSRGRTSPKPKSKSNAANAFNGDATAGGGINPLHTLAEKSKASPGRGAAAEAHIVRVTKDRVEIHQGPLPPTLLDKVSKSLVHTIDTLTAPPPPPPLSEQQMPPSPPDSLERFRQQQENSLPTPPTSSPTDTEEVNIVYHSPTEDVRVDLLLPGGGQPPSPDQQQQGVELPLTPPGSKRRDRQSPSKASTIAATDMRRASTETSVSFITPSIRSHLAKHQQQQQQYQQHHLPPTSQSTDNVFLDVNYPSSSSKSAHLSHDGYLQPPGPPSIIVSKPVTRRNTISSPHNRPSSTLLETRQQLSHYTPGAVFHGQGENGVDGENVQVDMDILMLADQIRRERKRAKERKREEEEVKQDGGDGAADGATLVRRGTMTDEKPLVGNLIGEGHVNYVLMYNMLTGIRIAVSRCQAKPRRALTEDDFMAAHKYSFDINGNELTPSAKYDFKFKDYAPWVFRALREDHFHIDPADYLLSLTAKYILSELGSPGKSGSFFYFSRDYRFIIKTIHHNEHKFLLSIMKDYYEHVKANPHTLLSRFYGLHRVKLPRGRKIHFVIMNNLFPPHKDIHETYDLKGSTVGRTYPEEKAKSNPRAVLKDNNWLRRGKTLDLGPEKRAFLTEQIRRDVELLERLNVMDYSLLVGIHNMKRGNRDNVRSNTLKVFSAPDVPPLRRRTTHQKRSSLEAQAMRRALHTSNLNPQHRLEAADLPRDMDYSTRSNFIFSADEGGYQATDEGNEPMEMIYYFGIIDICTTFTWKKWVEGCWKGLSADRHKVSPVPAMEYGQRFFKFLTGVMRGGNRDDFLPPDMTEAKVDGSKEKTE